MFPLSEQIFTRRTATPLVLLGVFSVCSPSAEAQISGQRQLPGANSLTATLQEQLTNRLRATRQEQRDYIKLVVEKVDDGKLERKLVVAIERYAIRRNPNYPFPYFERALRYEAGKRGVPLPTVRQVASTSRRATL